MLITDRPGQYDWRVYRGATSRRVMRFLDNQGEPIDLAPYTFHSQVRTTYEGSLLTVPTISKDVIPGQITITVNSDMESGTHVWDLLVTQEDEIGVLLYGSMIVQPRVTEHAS